MAKKKSLKYENKLFAFLTKIADLILLSLMWMIFCIPILTMTSSTAALYYATVKVVRKDAGSALKEFMRSFKVNLKQGCILTFWLIVFALLVWSNLYIVNSGSVNQQWIIVFKVFFIPLSVAGVFTVLYLFATLSRFTFGCYGYIKMSFGIAFRHVFSTLFLILISFSVIELVYVIPPLILIAPATLTYINSFIIERIFRRYMEKPDDDIVEWYWMD